MKKMPYYCSCERGRFGNTVSSTVLTEPQRGTECLKLQQVQFRDYDPAAGGVINWSQTFTLTPTEDVILCSGTASSVSVPWTSISESLMKVTKVEDYGEVTTSIDKEGRISFSRFDVEGRCNGQCPLNFQTATRAIKEIHPFQTTT